MNKPKLCVSETPIHNNTLNPPKCSLNWSFGLKKPEIIKQKTGKTLENQPSRLSKNTIFKRFYSLYEKLSTSDVLYIPPKQPTYSEFKNSVKDYITVQKTLEDTFVSAGLGKWIKKPVELNLFQPQS